MISPMADIKTKEERSRNIAAIRSKNTKPEMLVRRFLHGARYRYRLHDRTLPGCPDLVSPVCAPSYLFMAVFGTAMKTASISVCQNRMRYFGATKSAAILSAMRKFVPNSKIDIGMSSLFGSVI